MLTKQLDVKPNKYKLYEKVLHDMQTIRDENQELVITKEILYFRDIVTNFNSYLSSLSFQDYQYSKVQRLYKQVKEYEGKYLDLTKSLNESFMLFVVGMGNYGKSTLINALLEQPAAETDFLPKTWKIDIYKNDISSNRTILRFKDQSERELNFKKAKQFIELEEKKRDDSEREISLILKKEKENIKSQEAYKEFETKLRREKLYESTLVEVHWGIKKGYKLNDFHIVDTPGLTQKVMGQFQHNIYKYYHKADGIIWMLDAHVISAKGTKELVEDLKKSLASIGGKPSDNTIAVLNRMDLVYKHQGQKGVDSVIEVANKFFGEYFHAIIPFSAKQAFDGIMNHQDEIIEKSGLPELHSIIHSQFRLNAKQIQCNKKMESCKSYGNLLQKELIEFTRDIEQDFIKLKRDHQKFINDLEHKSNELKKQINTTINSYKKKVEENISYHTDTLFDISSLDRKKAYANETIFDAETISIQIKKLQNEISVQCNELMQFYHKKLFFTEYPHLFQESLPVDLKKQLGIKLDLQHNQFDTEGIAIGSGIAGAAIAAMFLGPVGLLIGGIASFFGGGFFAKQTKIANLKSDLKKTLEKTTFELKVNLKVMVKRELRHVEQEITQEAIRSFNTVYGITREDAELDELINEIQNLLDASKRFTQEITGDAPDLRPTAKEILLMSK